MARKKRGPHRKSRRAPSRGLLIGIAVVLTGVAVLIARSRVPPSVRPEPAPAQAAAPKSLVVDSDWDRVRLRLHAEYLRTVRAGDRAALLGLTSRTLRGALEEVGVDRSRIDERPGAAAKAGASRAPVQWHILVPRRASLYRINDALTQAIGLLGGHVIRGLERPAPLAGLLLDLRLGFNGEATHSIVVEPTGDLSEQGAQIALIVTDLDRVPAPLYRAFLRSTLPYSVALKPVKADAGWIGRDMRGARHEILLHLPMEPKGYPRIDPGRDAILLDLSRIEIEDRITRCLSAVGPVQAVVSRHGSAALNDPDVMRAVLDELKRRDLPFIDAHGAGPSVADEVGEETGARTFTAAAILDGNTAASPSALRARVKELVASAVQRGSLVVVVRPSMLVLNVLESEMAKAKGQGVSVVPISQVAL